MKENQIGDEGAKSLSEILKVNTRLVSLYLQSASKENNNKRICIDIMYFNGFLDNGIGKEGAKALGDSLKSHKIIDIMWLGCVTNLISD